MLESINGGGVPPSKMAPTVDDILAPTNKGGNKPTFVLLSAARREGIGTENRGGALPSAYVLCVSAPSPSAQPVFIESKNRGGALPSAYTLCVAAAPSPSAQPVFIESENRGGALPSASALCVAVPSPSAQPVFTESEN